MYVYMYACYIIYSIWFMLKLIAMESHAYLHLRSVPDSLRIANPAECNAIYVRVNNFWQYIDTQILCIFIRCIYLQVIFYCCYYTRRESENKILTKLKANKTKIKTLKMHAFLFHTKMIFVCTIIISIIQNVSLNFHVKEPPAKLKVSIHIYIYIFLFYSTIS